MGGFNYSAWDDKVLKLLYKDQLVEDIAFILDRTATSIYSRATKIGAKRTA